MLLYGPFQIQEPINEMTYKFKLPPNWKTHNAFHASLLKAFKGAQPVDPIHEDPLEFDENDEITQPKLIL